MVQRSVGNTALGAAVCRLIEQYQPEKTRLFYDPVVSALVSTTIRVLMQLKYLRDFTIKQTDAFIPGADKLMNFVAKNNAPWLFGLELSAIASFLQSFHLRLIEDVGNADYRARYLEPLGRELVVSEVERIVQATVIRA